MFLSGLIRKRRRVVMSFIASNQGNGDFVTKQTHTQKKAANKLFNFHV